MWKQHLIARASITLAVEQKLDGMLLLLHWISVLSLIVRDMFQHVHHMHVMHTLGLMCVLVNGNCLKFLLI